MNASRDVPPLAWRWLSIAAVLVLVATVAGIGFISAGTFDPRPLGTSDPVTSAPGERALGPGEALLEWLALPPPDATFTARLTAAWISGEPDGGYGLAIGAPGEAIVAAMSPTGYASLLRVGAAAEMGDAPLRSWQTWPHVRTGAEPNEIWLDVRGGRLVAVRINRELLWQGSEPLGGTALGLWAENYGGPSSVAFQLVEQFGERH
jgi:hypothetical protein